jgi:hypothetical protein
MQTANITAINAAKSIGSSPHDRAIGPMLAQSDSVGRNPEPDGPMYSQIIAGMIHCRLRRGSAVTQTQSVGEGFSRVACHILGPSLVATARSGARRVPGGSSAGNRSTGPARGKIDVAAARSRFDLAILFLSFPTCLCPFPPNFFEA